MTLVKVEVNYLLKLKWYNSVYLYENVHKCITNGPLSDLTVLGQTQRAVHRIRGVFSVNVWAVGDDILCSPGAVCASSPMSPLNEERPA